jgi:hypothetical protein
VVRGFLDHKESPGISVVGPKPQGAAPFGEARAVTRCGSSSGSKREDQHMIVKKFYKMYPFHTVAVHL